MRIFLAMAGGNGVDASVHTIDSEASKRIKVPGGWAEFTSWPADDEQGASVGARIFKNEDDDLCNGPEFAASLYTSVVDNDGRTVRPFMSKTKAWEWIAREMVYED
jgi:hypothetical protein